MLKRLSTYGIARSLTEDATFGRHRYLQYISPAGFGYGSLQHYMKGNLYEIFIKFCFLRFYVMAVHFN